MTANPGHSEAVIGRAVAKWGKPDQVVTATKLGLSVEGEAVYRDSSRTRVFEEVETSLKYLQTDYIDLYQVYWPDFDTPYVSGDDLRLTDPKFQQPRFARHLKAVRLLERYARERYGKSLPALAVRWVLDQPGVAVALWGPRHPEELDPVYEVVGWHLDPRGPRLHRRGSGSQRDRPRRCRVHGAART